MSGKDMKCYIVASVLYTELLKYLKKGSNRDELAKVLLTVFGGVSQYLRLFLYVAKSLEAVVVQRPQACIFFVNTRHKSA